MKSQTLPVKRRLAPKGIFKRLRAVTGKRKQRVAAAATSDMDLEDSSSKISRALTIIFLIHIVAIGLIFVHQKFLDGRPPDVTKAQKVVPKAVITMGQRAGAPRLSAGEQSYAVLPGDKSYAVIADLHGIDEGELRAANPGREVLPGVLLRIPPKRVAALEPTDVKAIREQSTTHDAGELVDAIPVGSVPAVQAQLVRPNNTQAAPVALSGKSYIVQNGDSVWRIANRFKVNQNALMKANGISDARKMKVGMTLNIPR
jgi:LysM repeat protein